MCTHDLTFGAIFVVFYAFVTNIPFWVASHFFSLQVAGVFCAEFAVIGLLALVVPKVCAIAFLSVFIVLDAVSATSQTYFLPPGECLKSFTSLGDLPVERLSQLFAVVALALLVITIAALFPDQRIRGVHRRRVAICLILFAVFIESSDSIAILRETHSTHLFALKTDGDVVTLSYFEKPRLSRNPLLRLVRLVTVTSLLSGSLRAGPADATPVPNAVEVAETSAHFISSPANQRPNLVVILVESWGRSTDSSVRDNLIRSYLREDLQTRYEVLQGAAPFYGGTIAGEARELCGNKMGYHLLDAPQSELKNCLPLRLEAKGYRTTAVHGMDGRMFDRSVWWATVGFEERWFRDRFQQAGLPICASAFDGICDASIARWIGDRLQAKRVDPQFVYWVTLNSHLPVPNLPQLVSPSPCSFSVSLAQWSAFCSWYQLVSNVHESVYELAMRNLGRPTVFVVVGDHAPPFANSAVRDLFSDTEVPFVALIPRDRDLGPRQFIRGLAAKNEKASAGEPN